MKCKECDFMTGDCACLMDGEIKDDLDLEVNDCKMRNDYLNREHITQDNFHKELKSMNHNTITGVLNVPKSMQWTPEVVYKVYCKDNLDTLPVNILKDMRNHINNVLDNKGYKSTLDDIKWTIKSSGLTECEDTNCTGCPFDNHSPDASLFNGYPDICVLLNDIYRTEEIKGETNNEKENNI